MLDVQPICPEHGPTMRLRTARRGPNAGGQFWGCSWYPKCHVVVPVTEPDQTSTDPGGHPDTGVAVPARRRRRVRWPAYGRRPGWTTSYLNAGGRLRSWDEAAHGDIQTGRALCQAVVFATETAHPRTSSVTIDVLRRILTRGDRPPLDPRVEHRVLDIAGLTPFVGTSTSRGDLGPRLREGAPLPEPEELRAAVQYREPFEFDRAALDHLGHPLVHASLELPWLTEYLPRVAGQAAGQWFSAQAWLDALAEGHLEATGSRRTDFLVAVPGRDPLVVEVDGRQHDEAAAVDRSRDQALRNAGVSVIRFRGADLTSDSNSTELLAHLPPTATESSPRAMALVWAPAVAARVARAILEAIEATWLAGGAWRIRLEEPTGVGAEAVGSTATLLAALDEVWATSHAPDDIVIDGPADTVRLTRQGVGYVVNDLAAEPSEANVVIRIEPFRGPFHQLPADGDRPQIVVRSASLPIDIAESHLEGGERQLVPDIDAVSSDALVSILRSVFGKEEFLPREEDAPRGQERSIRRLLAGQDAVVLLPTGGGKSLIYQFAGLLLPGRTLVIDPIISLIDDQLEGLRGLGIDRAVGISRADRTAGTVEEKLDAVRTGDALFCFVAPERLQQSVFRDAIRTLSVGAAINLCVVDEAHCVSEWGHDFRPSYLDLGRVLRAVAVDTAGNAPPLLALTGTASRIVLRDMLIELSIDRADPAALITPRTFDRPELTFSVVESDASELSVRLAGVVQSLPARFGMAPAEFFRRRGEDSMAGIVFCQTKARRDRGVFPVRNQVQANLGIRPGFYAGEWTKASGVPYADWDRVKQEQAAAFKGNETTLLVATKAYGMGIDKPNVRFIVHAGIASSIEAYYQEAGRAGRDGRPAQCVIVHDEDGREFADWALGQTFAGADHDLAGLTAVLHALRPINERRTVKLPMTDDKSVEVALHRLRLLGVVREYLVDWGARSYEVRLRSCDPDDVDDALVAFVRRSSPGRAHVIESELRAQPDQDLEPRVLSDARRLINYIYETIVASRRRAIGEMVQLAETCRADAAIRSRILSYLELGQIAAELEVLIEAEPFVFAPWQELYDRLETLDDARDLRGASARLLESAPDNPGLLLGRGLAEAMVADGDIRVFSASATEAMSSAQEKFGVTEEDLALVLEWLAGWMHERKPSWAALSYLVAERSLGNHLNYLEPAERRAIVDLQRETSGELGVILTRRLERLATGLEEATRHVTRGLA